MTFEKEQLDVISSEFRDVKIEDDWKKVKNRKMKDHLITNFILNQKQLHKLSWFQARQAYSTIRNALYVFRTHKSHDITMNNGNIESIDDIIINAQEITNTRFFTLTEEQAPLKRICLEKEWIKYCNNFNKKCRSMLGIEVEEVKRKRGSAVSTATKSSSNSSSSKTKSSGKMQQQEAVEMKTNKIVPELLDEFNEEDEEQDDDEDNNNDEENLDDDEDDDETISNEDEDEIDEEMDCMNDYNGDCE
jgi:hypothetical protein